MKKVIVSCLFFVSSLSFALTNEQINQVKKQIALLEQSKSKIYKNTDSHLKGTNIRSYIEYKEISSNPDMFSQKDIAEYFSKNKNEYWALELCDDLAIHYAKTKNWKMFKKYYDGDLESTGKCWITKQEYNEDFKRKSVVDYSQYMPTKTKAQECTDMKTYWKGSADSTKDCFVDKAYSLALANDFDESLILLTNHVKQEDYTRYIAAWKKVTKNPKGLDKFIKQYHNYPDFNEVLIEISNDQIKYNLKEFAEICDNLQNTNYIDAKLKDKLTLTIAVSLARSHNTRAKVWYARVDTKHYTNIDWEWLLRLDIYTSSFKNYIVCYNKLPKKLKDVDAWKYWLAYSYSKTGNKAKAKPIYEKLSNERFNYYSFLASDELGKPYVLEPKDVKTVSAAKKAELLKDSVVSQAIELHRIGEFEEAAKLWKWHIRKQFKDGHRSSIPDLSNLAWSNKMYFEAIFSMGMMGMKNNTSILFPSPYEEIIKNQSEKFSVEKALILSIMRKESQFYREANSSVNAKGLMQVTLPTAKFVSKKYKINSNGDDISSQIFNPSVNIKSGSANLHFLDGLFKDNLILSIAAYNAGPGNVAKWLTKQDIPVKQWIENMPFGETRHYVRNVLVNMVVYNDFVLKSNELKISNLLSGSVSDKFSFKK